MPDELSFATAEPTDTTLVVDLVNRAYSPLPDATGWVGDRGFQPGDRTDASEVGALITAPSSIVLVGRRNGDVVSCCAITHGVDGAYLGLFAVDPDRQGGGAGRQTMARAEDEVLRRWGLRRVDIHVMEHHDTLRHWYERLGYRDTGERKAFAGSAGAPVATLVGMRKELGPS